MKSHTSESKPTERQDDQDRPQLSAEEWRMVVDRMSAAPLNNMQHAAAVDALIIKVMKHAGLVESEPKEV